MNFYILYGTLLFHKYSCGLKSPLATGIISLKDWKGNIICHILHIRIKKFSLKNMEQAHHYYYFMEIHYLQECFFQ